MEPWLAHGITTSSRAHVSGAPSDLPVTWIFVHGPEARRLFRGRYRHSEDFESNLGNRLGLQPAARPIVLPGSP